MHLAGGDERRHVRREVGGQQAGHQHAAGADDVAHLGGQVVAAIHEDELDIVLVDERADALEHAVRLIAGVVGDDLHHMPAHADLDAAHGIDAVAPDHAAEQAGFGPCPQAAAEGARKPIFSVVRASIP